MSEPVPEPEHVCDTAAEELSKREWSLIEQLEECALAHEKQGHCLGHRTSLVARLMLELELSPVDIGFVVCDLLDLQSYVDSQIEKAAEPDEDKVLDAQELSQ